MIATEYRLFVNHDARYRFKFDSGTVQNDAIRLKGKVVTIRKYGWRIALSMYEGGARMGKVTLIIGATRLDGDGFPK